MQNAKAMRHVVAKTECVLIVFWSFYVTVKNQIPTANYNGTFIFGI